MNVIPSSISLPIGQSIPSSMEIYTNWLRYSTK